MGFKVISGSPQTVWAPIADSDTIYIGQLVKCAGTGGGISPAGTASGAADTTGKGVLYGIVVGTNNSTPAYNSTYRTEYITDATPKASTTIFTGHEGPWSKGDHCAMAEVSIINPSTVVRAPIFKGAVGTVLPEMTVTASKGHYGQATIDTTLQHGYSAGTSYYGTAYFRTGPNAGAYRLLTSQSSSICLTWDKDLYAAASNDDKVIVVKGIRPNGLSKIFVDSESLFISNAVTSTVNYYLGQVVRLDLRESGNEFCDFTFAPPHFDLKRA